jgi:hypothetical protein
MFRLARLTTVRQNSSATMERRAGRTEFLAVNVKKRDALHESTF